MGLTQMLQQIQNQIIYESFHLKTASERPPIITEDDFEDFLATDDLLVEYFNEFLSLPTFPEVIKFNKIFGIFEVINNVPESLTKHIKKLLRENEPPNPVYNATRIVTGLKPKTSSSTDLNINNSYNTMCLNREQGVQWIKKERLPAFLISDCYFEYRLAKLMSQVKLSNTCMPLITDPNYHPWTLKREMALSPPPETENKEIMHKFFVTLGEATFSQTKEWFSIAKHSEQTTSTASLSQPTAWGSSDDIALLHSTGSQGSEPLEKVGESKREEDEYSVSIAMSPSPTPIRLYIERKLNSREEISKDVKQKMDPSEGEQSQKGTCFHTLEEFAQFFVGQILKSAVFKLSVEATEDVHYEDDIYNLSDVSVLCVDSPKALSIHSDYSETSIEEEIINVESDSDGQDSLDSWCTQRAECHINSRKEFERFKLFLKGTPGEKLWLLWLDIERLKAINDTKKQQSHLNKMKKLYLVTSEDNFIKAEVLQRLRLLDTNQWNVNHLQHVQTEIVKSLLLYWGPRFCLSDSSQIGADIKLWSRRQLRPKRDADPFAQMATLLPLRPKSCMPRISTSAPPVSGLTRNTAVSSCKSSQNPDLANSIETKQDQSYTKDIFTSEDRLSVLKGSSLEAMLQALHHDSRAGHFFVHFCEQSGNKLWENSVCFWFDLQFYHHLFYQETLQPYKLCQQSQFLFGTYLAPSATKDIGVEQIIKKEIYQKLDPPFEDLFDAAEEYILTLLLSAWMEMNKTDRQAYEKVELVEESRQLESVCYQKLQALCQEKASKRDEIPVRKSVFVPPPDIAREPNLWEQVPDEYKNFNLGTLIRHRMELEHFRKFLEDNFASMDLMCWIDLEQFRRMPHKEKEKRQEKAKDIKNKYLNKKYFFGPNSPATRDQQEQVMQLAGGWGRILHDRLSSNVLIEIQKYVRMRIEKKWLPLFLATEEFRERWKAQAQMKDVAEDIIFQTNKKKIGVWKHLDSKWISSSKEIIAFRKALLNPVTASQFQKFLSLKGDFLENGLLFWQEVQKYKDLCHSHCDDFTIQNKITAIINCFINSSIPPALQIDIPPEQAEKILEKRRDLGPYVFREAQMTIFSIMFKFWPAFTEFRSNLADEKIMPLLERKKAKKLEQLKRKMRDEEKLAKQRLEDGKRKESLFNLYGDIENESTYSGEIFPGEGMYPDNRSEEMYSARDGYGRRRNISWTYSKYVEALEQERMLLKIQEDLEKKSRSSLTSDTSSLYTIKTENSKTTGKTYNSSNQLANIERISSAIKQRQMNR
ncbi:regulator of G-protein signaling 22 [Bombina bombina]|uniref:regulator of G-protein signaling 22 n=1 Tax=Bombina bombina TaxID=8345 RepID=UPI00235AC0C9|nr:regulator of G-protein signaling 22 [Bombina bombina]